MRRFFTLFFLLAFAIACPPARASMHEVDAGETPALDADEGFLLISIDSDAALGGLRLQRSGGITATMLSNIKPGVRARLYVATAGSYYFDHASVTASGNIQFKLGEDGEFHFVVKPGIVNYPGDLLFRAAGLYRANIHVSNRGLRAMDWLDATHPALRNVSFAYAGEYPDPFPAFYRQARGTQAGKAAAVPMEASATGVAADVEDLWRPDRIKSMRMSPNGELVADVFVDKDRWCVDLVNVKRGTSLRLAKVDVPVDAVAWKGDRALVLVLGSYVGRQLVKIVTLDEVDAAQPRVATLTIDKMGSIVDFLPGDEHHVLYSTRSTTGRLVVQKVDITSEKAIAATDFGERRRLNQGVVDDYAWFTDGTGQLRAAIAQKNGAPALYYGAATSFREIQLPGKPGAFRPIGLSPTGDAIYGITDDGRDQNDLVVLDPTTQKVSTTLFSKPGIDVTSAIFDATKRPIGVTFYRDGQLATEYFDPARARLNARVANAFPGESVIIVDHDEGIANAILRVESATRPTTFFHLDLRKKQAALLDESRPWLKDRKWSPTKVIHTQGTDHTPIEAYLTLPATIAGKLRPVVVMAHGGPIGIRDEVRFDPEVQLIASLGYAVLQVNFRGSDGYGRAFREAGKGRFGTLIEDDIDAALTSALATYPLDGDRICALGASYGGYSSMISAIRWPQRFRCVVSMMGISDELLMFTSSDSAHTPDGRKAWAEVIGDPLHNGNELMQRSPLYRYRELKTPLLLIHGTEDGRVDFEHTRRLARMLALAGHPPQLIEVKDAGHGFVTAEQRKQVWPAAAKFLQDHLGAP